MLLSLPQPEGFFQRIASVLFPPKLPTIKDLSYTADYVERMNRTGYERRSGCVLAGAWIESGAKEREVFLLGPRTVWPD